VDFPASWRENADGHSGRFRRRSDSCYPSGESVVQISLSLSPSFLFVCLFVIEVSINSEELFSSDKLNSMEIL